MGYNTTIVFLNDAIDNLDKDPDLGKNLQRAIKRVSMLGGRADCPVGNHVNAIQVIETHHSSCDKLIRIGGNTGIVVDDVALEM